MMQKLFGSKKVEEKKQEPPKLDVNDKEKLKETEKEYKKKLMHEQREIERAIYRNDQTQKKCEAELKKALKDTNDKAIHNIYAKQVLQCRNTKLRLLNNKAKIQGLVFSIESMFTNMKMTKMLGDTSEVLKQINGVMNIKEMQGTMKDIQKSMMQFGLMNEMVEDVMSEMDADADDMNDTDLDKIIDSVKNPDKYKNEKVEDNHANELQDDPLDDIEARIKSLS